MEDLKLMRARHGMLHETRRQIAVDDMGPFSTVEDGWQGELP